MFIWQTWFKRQKHSGQGKLTLWSSGCLCKWSCKVWFLFFSRFEPRKIENLSFCFTKRWIFTVWIYFACLNYVCIDFQLFAIFEIMFGCLHDLLNWNIIASYPDTVCIIYLLWYLYIYICMYSIYIIYGNSELPIPQNPSQNHNQNN